MATTTPTDISVSYTDGPLSVTMTASPARTVAPTGTFTVSIQNSAVGINILGSATGGLAAAMSSASAQYLSLVGDTMGNRLVMGWAYATLSTAFIKAGGAAGYIPQTIGSLPFNNLQTMVANAAKGY